MSQTQNLDVLFERLLLKVFDLYKNADITKNEKGWASAINSQHVFLNAPDFDNDFTRKLLAELETRFLPGSDEAEPLEIIIENRAYHYSLDLPRIHSILGSCGLTEMK